MIQIKWLKDRVESQEELIRALREQQLLMRDHQRASRRPAAHLPTSSDVYCQGEERVNRTCRFRNLCLATHSNQFFTLKGPHSLYVNVPPLNSSDLVDLTTLDGHNVFFWTIQEVVPEFFLHKMDQLNVHTLDVLRDQGPRRLGGAGLGGMRGTTNLTIVKGRTYLAKRFFPLNIMHTFHDDWLGLYALRDLWPSLRDAHDEYYEPLPPTFTDSKNRTRVVSKMGRGVTVFEHHTRQPYDNVFDWLGRFHRLEGQLGWREWPSERRPEAYICWEDAVVGNSKNLAWYQYGYGKPQGPIPGGYLATGYKLREAALYALRQMGLGAWDHKMQAQVLKLLLARQKIPPSFASHGACIAVFSRKSTRLILNEPALQAKLEGEFGLPVCWIRLEENTIPQLIAKLRRAVMAFGMHGSLLILCMFLPPGAVVIEGYPYGVPAENYTPFREMTRLPGVQLSYRSWVAASQKDCIPHPERGPRQGGVKHLNESYRNFITSAPTIPLHHCCDNPHWLYRIFQDTTVDPDGIAALFREALSESYEKLPAEWK